MTLTVTLADALKPGNGRASQLPATSVTVASAVLKAGSSWSDNQTAPTATYTAQTIGSGLKAQVKFNLGDRRDRRPTRLPWQQQ